MFTEKKCGDASGYELCINTSGKDIKSLVPVIASYIRTNKMKAEQIYAAMNPWRLFFIVAMPGMISMFAMSIYSIVEGIFIGKILGEGAFAV